MRFPRPLIGSSQSSTVSDVDKCRTCCHGMAAAQLSGPPKRYREDCVRMIRRSSGATGGHCLRIRADIRVGQLTVVWERSRLFAACCDIAWTRLCACRRHCALETDVPDPTTPQSGTEALRSPWLRPRRKRCLSMAAAPMPPSCKAVYPRLWSVQRSDESTKWTFDSVLRTTSCAVLWPLRAAAALHPGQAQEVVAEGDR